MPTLRHHWAARAVPILLGGVLQFACARGCSLSCSPEPAPPPPRDAGPLAPASPPLEAIEPPPEPTPETFTASKVRGNPEIRHASATEWVPLKERDPVAAEESIRTSEDESVEISLGKAQIRLREHSQLTVQDASAQLPRFRLAGGLDAEVPEGAIEVAGEGSEAIAHASMGRLAMTSDGKGVVAIASVSGGATLETPGRKVEVQAGRTARIRPRIKPETPALPPKKVLFTVVWPERREVNLRKVSLSGEVEPGSRVFFRGKVVPLDSAGRFQTPVGLRPGTQTVLVRMEDVLGRKERDEKSFTMDDVRPNIELENKPWSH